jgi:hypothetical protein
MSISEVIEKVNSLDVWEKLSIYIDYFNKVNALKLSSIVVDKKSKSLHGWGTPDKEVFDLAFFKIKNLEIMTFEDFSSKDNIFEIDHGMDWQKYRYAQRHEVKLFGIYKWYETWYEN